MSAIKVAGDLTLEEVIKAEGEVVKAYESVMEHFQALKSDLKHRIEVAQAASDDVCNKFDEVKHALGSQILMLKGKEANPSSLAELEQLLQKDFIGRSIADGQE